VTENKALRASIVIRAGFAAWVTDWRPNFLKTVSRLNGNPALAQFAVGLRIMFKKEFCDVATDS
jgi:hypothetical protein